MSVVVSDENSLHSLLMQLEDVCVNAFTGSENDPPDIIFHSVGPPPMDCCDMLAFEVAIGEEATSPTSPAMSGGRKASYQRVNLISIVVTILRCVPTITAGGSVDTAQITAATETIRRDGWLLWNAIMHAIRNGEFLDRCSDVDLDRAIPVREQGGCAGWRILLRAELGGIPNPGPAP